LRATPTGSSSGARTWAIATDAPTSVHGWGSTTWARPARGAYVSRRKTRRRTEGKREGEREGAETVGDLEGLRVGERDGLELGPMEGLKVGAIVGARTGDLDGDREGCFVVVGRAVGLLDVGRADGLLVVVGRLVG